MIIKRVLNNNAVMCLDEHDNEIIIKGKGIAFQKKSGDVVDKDKIETVFRSQNIEIIHRYQEVLTSVPNDIIEVSEQVIDVIKENVDKDLSDKIYVTLTDHIHNLIERISMGIAFDHGLLWDVKRLYKEEYQAGLKAVEIIRKRFDVKIDDDEASFIALHIVNAQINNTEVKDIVATTRMIEDVYTIVESDFNLELDKDSLDYTRFLMHLRIFFERILNKSNLKAEGNQELLNTLKEQYPQQYDTVLKILKYVSTMYKESLDGEILFLLVHVVKLTNH
ncbi:PRD domain-containing protein [Breznakia pachnodae]|uniref:Beta-glucoside operon transcriptional antiterminator n=1 Tax=Breznakia pachnodae TaxID=265178 RepID=A0ABU0E4I6_9FIRM|nr:PRD domain-containing protein [Breznakia pachnodae]MDQ0361817.1 beta-glucoside operon transcriptional antiterminator [Breznakia pachnodae]